MNQPGLHAMLHMIAAEGNLQRGPHRCGVHHGGHMPADDGSPEAVITNATYMNPDQVLV